VLKMLAEQMECSPEITGKEGALTKLDLVEWMSESARAGGLALLCSPCERGGGQSRPEPTNRAHGALEMGQTSV
jgi:hypothetical protein